MLESLGARGKRLGIETNSYGLTHFNGKAVDEALADFCTLVEANDLVDPHPRRQIAGRTQICAQGRQARRTGPQGGNPQDQGGGR